MKAENLNSPWITKGIKKSSRKKQHIYKNFLKNKTTKRLKTYINNIKLYFKKIFIRSKNLFLYNFYNLKALLSKEALKM